MITVYRDVTGAIERTMRRPPTIVIDSKFLNLFVDSSLMTPIMEADDRKPVIQQTNYWSAWYLILQFDDANYGGYIIRIGAGACNAAVSAIIADIYSFERWQVLRLQWTAWALLRARWWTGVDKLGIVFLLAEDYISILKRQ